MVPTNAWVRSSNLVHSSIRAVLNIGKFDSDLMEERRVRHAEVVPVVSAGAERHVVGRGHAGARAGGQRAGCRRTEDCAAAARYVVVAYVKSIEICT